MLSEDEALLQLDRELDERMRNLCRKGSIAVKVVNDKVTKTNLYENNGSSGQNSPSTSGSQRQRESDDSLVVDGIGLNTVSEQIVRKDDHVNAMDILNKDKIQSLCTLEENTLPKVVGNTESGSSLETTGCHPNKKDEFVESSEKASEEDLADLHDDQDVIFDDFLDQSTKIQIKSLRSKVSHLTEVLNIKQAECKKLSQAKQEALSSLQAAEKTKRVMSKQLQTTQQESARLCKSNKHLSERVKELTCESQMLRKELSNSKQSHCEQKSVQTSSRAQLTRLRAENATLKEQVVDLKKKHKDEVDELRSVQSSNSARIKELERQQRNYCALVKKQELLIRVLNEQKINIGVAKTAACLEEKFLSILTPLQPP